MSEEKNIMEENNAIILGKCKSMFDALKLTDSILRKEEEKLKEKVNDKKGLEVGG